MKMNVLKSMLVAFAVVSLFAINACNKAVDSTDPYDGTVEYSVAQYDVNSYNVIDGTLDNDISVETILPFGVERPGDTGNGRELRPPMKQNPLGKIFRDLKLTPDQLALVKELMKAHRECEFGWLKQLRDSQIEIMKAAAAERKAVLQDLKDSVITREEARAAIKQINMDTREALKNNPLNEEVKKGLKDCMEAFINGMKEILTPEQLVKWNRFISSLPPLRG